MNPRGKIIIQVVLLFLAFKADGLNAKDTLHLKEGYIQYNSKGLVFGVHQFRNTFFEIGISKSKLISNGCGFGTYFFGRSVSLEYNPFQNRAGLALTTWTGTGTIFTMGININSFTDFESYNLGIKPFFGIGPGQVSITYGYNFLILNNDITDLNRHCVSLRIYLPFRKIKYDYNYRFHRTP